MELRAELVEGMTEETSTPLAKVVKDLMTATNLTQEKMAKRLGVSTPMVNLILSGKANPSYAILTRLVDAFGVDPRLLFRDWANAQEERE